MCGIAAVLRDAPDPSPPAGWDICLARLARRGPDGEGTWRSRDGLATLGHRRLAVVDLSDAGRQPMANEDGTIVVTFNGEIYNADGLRSELASRGHVFASRADTEVLVHGYEQWGERGLLSRIEGMYAFVIWDNRARRAVAAVDHAGMKPLAWACEHGSLKLASDCDALRPLLRPRKLDATGLCHVLSLGYCPAPRTVWEGVQKLPPGHGLVWTPGSPPTIFRHWSPPDTLGTGDEFGDVWTRVIAEHLIADVPVGLLLSGGLDSSALSLGLRGRAVRCTTISLPGSADESGIASSTARMLGLEHKSVSLEPGDVPKLLELAAAAFDEPQAFGALLTMTRVAHAARATGKVVLSGDGGDEAFAGYTWHRGGPAPKVSAADAEAERMTAEPDAPPPVREAALRALASRSFVHAHLQRVMPRFHPHEVRALLSPLEPAYDADVYASWLAGEDRPDLPSPRREQRLDLRGFCAGSILPKVDRAAMSVGLEIRTPFLDRRVLAWALRRPVEAAERDAATSKPVIRRMLQGRVPTEVLTKEKQGFSLRLGRGDVFTSMQDWLAGTRLVRDGVLCDRWPGFVAPGTPSREARMFALCMMASWAQDRL